MSIDVLIDGLVGILEMKVINVLGDTIQEPRVCEHLGDVANVLLCDVGCAAIVLQHNVCLLTIFIGGLQSMLVEEEYGSPYVPVVHHSTEEELVVIFPI